MRVAEQYLDGKPRTRGKHKITNSERDSAFWSLGCLFELPVEFWQSEVSILALARYLAQERIANPDLLEHVARMTPATICYAIRYSRMALQPGKVRRAEI